MKLLEVTDDSQGEIADGGHRISRKELQELLGGDREKTDQLCLITEDPEILKLTARAGVCTVFRDCRGSTGDGIVKDAAAVITSERWEEDPEDEWFSLLLDHYHHRPHVIAEDSKARLRIRESIPEDYKFLDKLVRECGPAVFPGAEGIISSPETFQRYIGEAYPLQGYGFWTVEPALAVEGRRKTCRRYPGIRRIRGKGSRMQPGTGRLPDKTGQADGEDGERIEAGRFIGWAGFAPAQVKSCCEDGLKTGQAEGRPVCLEIGYALSPEYRGYGLGEIIVRLCLDYAADNLGADCILARTGEENEPSKRLIQKLGFVRGKDVYCLKISRSRPR